MKKIVSAVVGLAFLALMIGCEVEPSNLIVSHVDFSERYRNVILDLPNGTFVPDNPAFDFNNPATWTGNMAQYVKHNYIYSVSCEIFNSGDCVAYDTEVDLHYVFDNGDEEVETVYIGNIGPYERAYPSAEFGSTNKQLVSCWAEAYWYD